MQIYDIGDWIKLRYKNGSIEYVKSLPEDKKDLVSLHYLVDGEPHKEDGCAFIAYRENGGSVLYEKYYLSGLLHRENAPADIIYYEDGSIRSEKYHLNGELHRKNGPAIIDYYKNGKVRHEEYYLNHYFHREGGPASIWYYKDGGIECEIYVLNGISHRADGPASIDYYKDGTIEYEKYYLNGEYLTKKQWEKEIATS